MLSKKSLTARPKHTQRNIERGTRHAHSAADEVRKKLLGTSARFPTAKHESDRYCLRVC
jgi:hypothetical protein